MTERNLELSDEILAELRPITIKFLHRLFHDEFPRIWCGDLTFNQIRVNNSIFTRGMLEGRPSSMTEIVDDLNMARTTVHRALTTLAQHFPPAFPDRGTPYVDERADPEDERKKLYGFTKEAKRRAHTSIDNLTQAFVDALSEMAPVLRKHGIVRSDTELMAFVAEDIPRLVEEYLKTAKDS